MVMASCRFLYWVISGYSLHWLHWEFPKRSYSPKILLLLQDWHVMLCLCTWNRDAGIRVGLQRKSGLLLVIFMVYYWVIAVVLPLPSEMIRCPRPICVFLSFTSGAICMRGGISPHTTVLKQLTVMQCFPTCVPRHTSAPPEGQRCAAAECRKSKVFNEKFQLA